MFFEYGGRRVDSIKIQGLFSKLRTAKGYALIRAIGPETRGPD
jgi:hypothetical protein